MHPCVHLVRVYVDLDVVLGHHVHELADIGDVFLVMLSRALMPAQRKSNRMVANEIEKVADEIENVADEISKVASQTA